MYVVPHNPPMSHMKKGLRDLFYVVGEPVEAQRDQATRPRTHSQQAEQESHSGLSLPGEHWLQDLPSKHSLMDRHWSGKTSLECHRGLLSALRCSAFLAITQMKT